MSFEAVNTVAQKTTTPAVDATVLPVQQDLVQIKKPDKKLQAQGIYIQPKLTVGAPDDPYEKEADAVADKVMRMPEQNFVQRKCADCEKEEKLHRKPISESITPIVQAKGEGNATVNNATANAIHSTKGNGSTLDANTQSFMSSRIGADFSSVKIHTDSEAIQMNRELNAKAFTTGNDIYFNEGQYQPNSDSGKYLLAHELTHVLQQGKANDKLIQRDVETDHTCPRKYSKKEKEKSWTEEGVLNSDVYLINEGLLIADFGVDRGSLKESAIKDPLLVKWLKEIEMDSGFELAIYGYSDCIGDKENNIELREKRAKRGKDLLGESARSRTKIVTHAPIKSYFASNLDIGFRAFNRSVIIKKMPLAIFNPKPKDKDKPVVPATNIQVAQVHDRPLVKLPCSAWEREIKEKQAKAQAWALSMSHGFKDKADGRTTQPDRDQFISAWESQGFSHQSALDVYDSSDRDLNVNVEDTYGLSHQRFAPDIEHAKEELRKCRDEEFRDRARSIDSTKVPKGKPPISYPVIDEEPDKPGFTVTLPG